MLSGLCQPTSDNFIIAPCGFGVERDAAKRLNKWYQGYLLMKNEIGSQPAEEIP